MQSSWETAGTTQVIVALYRVLAGAMAALTVAYFALVLGPVWQGGVWAQPTVIACVLIVGFPAAVVPYRVEQATGVRTPWRASVGLIVAAILGMVLMQA